MINITSNTARQLYQQEFERNMTALENVQIRELKPVLNRQYMRAAQSVQKGMLDIDFAVDKDSGRLKTLLSKHYRRIATVFGEKVFKAVEEAQKSIAVPEIKGPKEEFWGDLNRWMSTEAAKKIRHVQDTTKKNIRRAIHKGMEEGESHRTIAKRVRKTGRISTVRRAVTIARTETHTAAVRSVDAGIASTRIEMMREWVSARDDRTRSRIRKDRFEHYLKFPAGPDGEKVAQDGKFTKTGEALDYPGDPAGSAGNVIHCRCFPADTKISGISPKGVTRQWYEGELTEVTTAMGYKFAGTPNHPVLTLDGWINLDLLNKGDSIFSSGYAEWMTISNPNVKDIQIPISEIFNAFFDSRHNGRVPRVNVNFHGQVPDQDVDVVFIDSSLGNTMIPKFFDPFHELGFTSANLAQGFAMSNSLTDKLSLRYGFIFPMEMSGGCNLPLFRNSCIGHTGEHGFRPVSMFDSSVFKDEIDKSPVCDIEMFCDSLNRFSSIKHFDNWLDEMLPFLLSTNNQGLAMGSNDAFLFNDSINSHSRTIDLFGDLLTGQPALIQLDSIVDIKRYFFSGHVYNLHDVKGFFIANGILSHNCILLYHTIRATDKLKPYEPEQIPYGEKIESENWFKDKAILGTEKSLRKKAGDGEAFYALDAKTGKSILERKGGKDYVDINDLSTVVNKSGSKSFVSFHNHPVTSASFGAEDLNSMINEFGFGGRHHIVFGNDGTKYKLIFPEKFNEFPETVVKSWYTRKESFMANYRPKVLSGEMTANEAWKEQSHKVMKEVATRYGIKYERVLP